MTGRLGDQRQDHPAQVALFEYAAAAHAALAVFAATMTVGAAEAAAAETTAHAAVLVHSKISHFDTL